jgi:hypothetical protein
VSEVAVAGEVFFLQFVLVGSSASVIHVVCAIDSVAHLQSVLRVLPVACTRMELSCFLETSVLRVAIDTLSLERLADDLTLYQSLSSAEVPNRVDDLGICGHFLGFDIDEFWALVGLYPGGAVLVIGGFVEALLGCSSESVVIGLAA